MAGREQRCRSPLVTTRPESRVGCALAPHMSVRADTPRPCSRWSGHGCTCDYDDEWASRLPASYCDDHRQVRGSLYSVPVCGVRGGRRRAGHWAATGGRSTVGTSVGPFFERLLLRARIDLRLCMSGTHERIDLRLCARVPKRESESRSGIGVGNGRDDAPRMVDRCTMESGSSSHHRYVIL